MFIPSLTSPTIGKVIQAVGTPYTGYGLEFKRNYDLDQETRKFQKIFIADVADDQVGDKLGDSKVTSDVDAQDVLEKEAKKIQPPGVSPQPTVLFGYKNCQSWLKEYVDWLVKRGILQKDAIVVLDNAPDR